MRIEWVTSPNHTVGRKGRKIIAIIDHITAGLMPGTLSWMSSPVSKASAHYLVTKAGLIYQMVKDENTAWHAGIICRPDWVFYDGTNPNYYTLGIEHEALAGEALTEAQYQATLELHRRLVAKHAIPVDRDHIIGHYRLDSVNRRNDPGPGFPWDRLFAALSPFANDMGISIIAGDKQVQGFLQQDRAWGPVREIASALGWQVEWLSHSRKAVLVPPARDGSSDADVGIAVLSNIIAGTLLEDTTFVPVRQLAEAMGYQVDWDVKTQTVKFKRACEQG